MFNHDTRRRARAAERYIRRGTKVPGKLRAALDALNPMFLTALANAYGCRLGRNGEVVRK